MVRPKVVQRNRSCDVTRNVMSFCRERKVVRQEVVGPDPGGLGGPTVNGSEMSCPSFL